jgi:lipoprotein NlpI
MRWNILAIAIAAATVRVGTVAAQNHDENWIRCTDGYSPEITIDACTKVIQSVQEPTEDLFAAFNSRGNAYTDKGQYERAIQDYNEALKLNPGYVIAYHNRGIARFALGQFADAGTDFDQKLTLDAKSAPGLTWLKLDAAHAYSVIWLHLAQGSMDADDDAELKRNAASVDYGKWPGAVVALYLGQTTPEEVRAAAERGDPKTQKDQRCEAAFYLGEYELLRKNSAAAKKFLQEAVDTCPRTFVEYIGAVTQLTRLGR